MSADDGGYNSGYSGLPPLGSNGPNDHSREGTTGTPSPGGSGSAAAGNPWSVPPSRSNPPSTPSASTPGASTPSRSGPANPGNPASASQPSDERASRKPVLRYVPNQQGSVSSSPNASGTASEPDERTHELPPSYVARGVATGQGPLRPARSARSARSQGPLVIVLSAVIVLGVIGALLAAPLRNFLATSNVPVIGGCGAGSPCQAATAYLADYGSGNYEAMYGYVSSASRTKFSSPDILGSNYKDAHDYIVNRTSAILSEAQITTIQTTPGDTTMKSDTSASVAVHVVMSSARLDPINQDLAIPLVKEGGKWMVSWTPGLIFKQLDDPSDPTYTHLVRLNETVGGRGTIFDRD
ncbi:MAG TPA: NTF2-like N-terminal transpeptidase domain-containing protein, partial [Ktedonobacterales bacterium]